MILAYTGIRAGRHSAPLNFTLELKSTKVFAMEKDEILLAEYSEAGNSCRAHEQHTRAALAAYIAFSTALLAITLSTSVTNGARVVLCFVGFGVGVFVANLVLRSKALYTSFVNRAKEIEAALGMQLYSNAWPHAQATGTFSSKQAIFGVVGLIAFFFFAASLWFAIR